ncbi:hypothetical protein E1B28_004603 [Marasmius oreades]|uniref:Uncharacterized protein n=1 Tax=Marasmius oreades TaxID=181124 RepID=A0A9P7UYZ2_9AGAR|nr:uncharacterized protein E1B28_004603 [Marasmius oreades]KAG7097232.1 hypothetical protein E1B28_004603 [Marasmius oreades]
MVQHTESPRSDADDDFEDPFRRLRLTNGIEHEGTSNLVRSQIVSVLPGQCHSLQDKILKLTFSRTDVDEAGSAQDLSIILSVDASPGCGGVVWPAGQILSNYLFTKGSTYLRGKNVLELGSGTGLVGLFASLLGPNHVWITDQAPLLGIMRHNISMNNLDSKCTVVGLDWSAYFGLLSI